LTLFNSDKNNLLLQISQARSIARRYLVTNGFDGALTMLGLMVGFQISGENIDLSMAINGCLGAAVALLVSGLSSAYMSETAERQKELRELEGALLTDLTESHHGHASRTVPIMVALVNGLSPFVISLLIIAPLWLVERDIVTLPLPPFSAAISNAMIIIFLLGVFLGQVSKRFWLWMGIRTLLIAMITVAMIILFEILLGRP
jgi:predicted membrane protein (TIGR00267 family)